MHNAWIRSPLHSKNTRVSVTWKRVHWGQTPFRVKDDPEIGQLSADLTNNGVRLTQLCVTFRVKLTDFRVIVDPEWSLAPMDPFRVNFWPEFFLECATGVQGPGDYGVRCSLMLSEHSDTKSGIHSRSKLWGGRLLCPLWFRHCAFINSIQIMH